MRLRAPKYSRAYLERLESIPSDIALISDPEVQKALRELKRFDKLNHKRYRKKQSEVADQPKTGDKSLKGAFLWRK